MQLPCHHIIGYRRADSPLVPVRTNQHCEFERQLDEVQ